MKKLGIITTLLISASSAQAAQAQGVGRISAPSSLSDTHRTSRITFNAITNMGNEHKSFEVAFNAYVANPTPANEQRLLRAATQLGLSIAQCKTQINQMINSLVKISDDELEQIRMILPKTHLPPNAQASLINKLQSLLYKPVLGPRAKYQLMH